MKIGGQKWSKMTKKLDGGPFEDFQFLFTLFLTSFFNQTTSVDAYNAKTQLSTVLKKMNFFIKSYERGKERNSSLLERILKEF